MRNIWIVKISLISLFRIDSLKPFKKENKFRLYFY